MMAPNPKLKQAAIASLGFQGDKGPTYSHAPGVTGQQVHQKVGNEAFGPSPEKQGPTRSGLPRRTQNRAEGLHRDGTPGGPILKNTPRRT